MNEAPTAPTREELSDLIRQTLSMRLKRPIEDITLETRFETLDLDSLDMAELFFLLEDKLQTTIPLEQGVHLDIVADVLELIVLHLPTSDLKHNVTYRPV